MNCDVGCKAAFSSLSIKSDGSHSLCANSAVLLDVFEVNHWADARTQDEHDLRSKVSRGGANDHCAACLKRTSLGFLSLKNHFDRIVLDQNSNSNDNFSLSHIQVLDINFSDLCNLKCRMCSGKRSTSWLAEEIALSKLLSFRESVRETSSEVLKEIPLEKFKSLHTVVFKGGEPLLQNEVWSFLEKLTASHDCKKINVVFFTNGTVPLRQIELLKNFKAVKLFFSFEGVGGIYSYIRGDWRTTSNLKGCIDSWDSLENASIDFMFTPQAYNVFSLVDSANWLISEVNPSLFHLSPQFDLNWVFSNLLIDPSYLRMSVLDKDLRNLAAETLVKSKFFNVSSFRALNRELAGYQSVEDSNNFVTFTQTLDQLRKSNLLDVEERFAPMFKRRWEIEV